MELHFENEICPALNERYPATNYTTGWMVGWRERKRIALKSIKFDISELDARFAALLRDHGWNVLFFHFDPYSRQFSLTKHQSQCSKEIRIAKAIIDEANKKLSTLFSGKIQTPVNEVEEMVEGLSETCLEKIWRNRCEINSLMGPIMGIRDLDALFWTDQRGFTIVEFKRKYPAQGHMPTTDKETISNIVTGDLLPEDVYNQDHLEAARVFGLDVGSHVKTVKQFREMGVRFLYMILDSDKRKASDHVGKERHAKYEQPFLWMYLLDESFKGLALTPPKKSGSFGNEPRYQLTLPVSQFKKLHLMESQRKNVKN